MDERLQMEWFESEEPIFAGVDEKEGRARVVSIGGRKYRVGRVMSNTVAFIKPDGWRPLITWIGPPGRFVGQ